MITSELRPYQAEAIENIRESIRGGVRRLAVQAPTGAGKTKLAASLLAAGRGKGSTAAFVVPSIDLVDQAAQDFWDEGIRDIGVIQGDNGLTDYSKPIQICSIQTIQRRGFIPDVKFAFFDECHRRFQGHDDWMKHPDWQNRPIIGLSATPWAKGMAERYQSLLVAATTKELIQQGYLVDCEVFAAPQADTSGVKLQKNAAGELDFQEKQLSEVMRKGSLTADIIETWKQFGSPNQSLYFGVDRAHAKSIQERFIAAGVQCGYQDADTPMDERRRIKAAFHSGAMPVVSNVATLIAGIDWDVRCIGLARPTRSEIMIVQIVGRGLRLGPGKEKLLMLDHTDTTAKLGFATDIHHEELRKGSAPILVRRTKLKIPKCCPKCTALKNPTVLICSNCGYEWDIRSAVVEEDGALERVDTVASLLSKKGKAHEATDGQKRQFFAELLGYAEERGYKRGWASNKFREKFKDWPDSNPAAVVPSPKMRSWIKASMIRWIKSKQRGDVHAG